MQLIGVSGYARSGKDEFAKALAPAGFKRLAFADVLRTFLEVLDPIVHCEGDTYITLQMVLERYGWNGYKNTKYADEVRTLLQRLGTDCGRNILGDTIWIDNTLNNLDKDGKYVVCDMRFPNELNAVKARGGKTVRISREGVGPANSHISETALDDFTFDYYIKNDGTLDEFYTKVKGLFL